MTRPWAQALTAQSRRILGGYTAADRPAPGTCAAVQAAAERRRTDHALVGRRVAAALIEAHGDEVLRVIAASLRDHLQGAADLDSMRGAGL